MDPNQARHDKWDENTDAARPDDSAVVAAAAGKTTRESDGEKQGQQQPTQQRARGPPLDDRAGDLLVGAEAILGFLVYLGMPEDTDVYYLRRAKRWPIGNTGGGGAGKLIASKRRLIRHAEELTHSSIPSKRRARTDQYELPAE